MKLTKEEEKMLAGHYGEGYRKPMEILVQLGEFYGADRLVPVNLCYLTKGPTPNSPGEALKWIEGLANLGATFKCPTFISTDFEKRVGDCEFEINRKLGAIPAFQGGGHPRNLFYLPVFGQQIIADGTAVTHYMNSYVGARANTECFIGGYSAAIVGKTPEYGLRLSENRVGKILFEIKTKLKDETDWSALGYYISMKIANNYWEIPVINGIDPYDITNDDLVTFSSSIPAYGAVVHSLLVGISPEALNLKQAFGGNEPKQTFTIGTDELNEVYKRFSPVEESPDMISIGAFGVIPSIEMVIKFTNFLEGKKVSQNFPTVILLDGPIKIVADRMGLTDKLKKSGVQIGMSEFIKERGLDPKKHYDNPVTKAKVLGLKNIVFTDAKSCHYAGNQGVNSVLKHIEECAQIAVTGRMEV